MRTLARMAFDLTYAWLVLTVGMLYDTISFRVDRMLHSGFCPCAGFEDDAPDLLG